ncbi:hypothetical protein D3C87_1089600 [compost metagenome]
MERRGTDTDERRRQQNQGEAANHRHHHDANQRANRPRRQQPGFRMPIGVITDPRLQQRCGQLKGQSNQADLSKGQAVIGLEHRVDRRQYRLDQVVDQMRQRHRADDTHHQWAALRSSGRRGSGGLNVADSHESFRTADGCTQAGASMCHFSVRQRHPLSQLTNQLNHRSIPVGAAAGCDLLILILKTKIKRSQPASAPTGAGCSAR